MRQGFTDFSSRVFGGRKTFGERKWKVPDDPKVGFGTIGDGGWGNVPLGCSVPTNGDWAPHYKTSGPDYSYGYSLVCQAGGTSYNGLTAEHVWSGYCGNSGNANQHLFVGVYEGNGDNTGNYVEKLQHCLQACVSKRTPFSGTWTTDAKSFHMDLNGRCWCIVEMMIVLMWAVHHTKHTTLKGSTTGVRYMTVEYSMNIETRWYM